MSNVTTFNLNDFPSLIRQQNTAQEITLIIINNFYIENVPVSSSNGYEQMKITINEESKSLGFILYTDAYFSEIVDDTVGNVNGQGFLCLNYPKGTELTLRLENNTSITFSFSQEESQTNKTFTLNENTVIPIYIDYGSEV